MYNGTQTDAPNASATNASSTPNGAEVDNATKNDTITNVYASQDLTFGKIVTGNQSSKDKYFDFTVTISNAVPGTIYTVDLTNADATSGTNDATITNNAAKTNVATITVPAAAAGETTSSVTTHFYLQNGQYITIQGLAEDTTYTITENAEDYTSTNGITAALSTLDWDGTTGNDALSDPLNGTIASADIHTGFTNDRSGTIPTGLLSTVAGSAGIIALGVIGVTGGAIYLKKKRSREE